MRARSLICLALVAAGLSLSACGFDFESRKQAQAEAQAAAAAENARRQEAANAARDAALPPLLRMYSASSVETLTLIGNGPRVVRVEGIESSPGWSDPQLRRVPGNDDSDGVLDIELVGRKPQGDVPQQMTSVLVEFQLSDADNQLQTVRVWTTDGPHEAPLHPAVHSHAE